MRFPVSGVECSVWLPPAAAFVVALATTPAGVSGAFLLLPFQMSVLGFSAPAVTPTNLIYNVVATPGGIARYLQEHRMAWPLAWAIVLGSLPGVFLGAAVRIRYLPDPRNAKLFVGCVLLYLGARLLYDGVRPKSAAQVDAATFRCAAILPAALVVGVIGGIYGVGGGAILAPFAMAILRLPARVVAGAALFGTLLTSIAGVASFEALGRTALRAGTAVEPDWLLGLLFGAGGLLGSYFGARLQKRLPERLIRLFLGTLVIALALAYVAGFIARGRL